MTDTSELSKSEQLRAKLAELRAKTDGELARVIRYELDRALLTVALVTVTTADRSLAENTYSECLQLISKVENVAERRGLETKLSQLRAALDRTSAITDRRGASACSARIF